MIHSRTSTDRASQRTRVRHPRTSACVLWRTGVGYQVERGGCQALEGKGQRRKEKMRYGHGSRCLFSFSSLRGVLISVPLLSQIACLPTS